MSRTGPSSTPPSPAAEPARDAQTFVSKRLFGFVRRAAWGLVVVGLTVLGRPAAAAPHLDPARETRWVPIAEGARTLARGTFVADAQGVALRAPAPERQSTWLLEGPTLGDGFLRVRLEGARPKHVGVLVRARARGGDARRVDGYHLAIRSDGIVWMRRDGGVLRELGASTTIRRLSKRRSLEVAVWLVGEHLVAEVFDGNSLASLGSVSVSDRAYASGGVGWMLFARTAPAVRLAAVWATPATGPAPAPRTGAQAAPAGPYRFFALAKARVAGLPAELRRRMRLLEPVREASGKVLVRADRLTYERLWRLRVAQEAQELDTPFRYLAPERMASPQAAGRAVGLDGYYYDSASLEIALRALAARSPRATLVPIGGSRAGRTLWALRIGGDDRRPAVLLNGAHHGDELVSVTQTLDAAARILDAEAQDPELAGWTRRLDLWIVPLVNPDGVDTFVHRSTYAGRKNGRDSDGDGAVDVDEGVDLNRNYPFRWGALGEVGSSPDPRSMYYRGDIPGSEPETQAMMRLVEAIRPVASISYHTWGTVVLWPYTTAGVPDRDAALLQGVADRVAKAAPRQPNGRRFRVLENIYPVDGVDQDWFRAATGAVALLVEGPGHNPRSERRLRAEIEAVRPTWRSLLQRVAEGPIVRGRLRRADGKPASASVHVIGDAHGDERWPARCRDGRFARLLPEEGAATVVIGEGETAVRVAARGGGRVDRVLPDGIADLGDCPRAELCSVDARCLAARGGCVAPGPGRFCWIDGGCMDAAPDTAGCACRPDRDPMHRTMPDGRRCEG